MNTKKIKEILETQESLRKCEQKRADDDKKQTIKKYE